jgi:polysaccharide export outer membrane protein
MTKWGPDLVGQCGRRPHLPLCARCRAYINGMQHKPVLLHKAVIVAVSGLVLLSAMSSIAAGRTIPKVPSSSSQRSQLTYNSYILGPGDSLKVEVLDIPELTGIFSIGPDGTIYLPRLRSLYVEGLTVEELRYFLTVQFRTYVKNPEIYISPVRYRPIRVYVGGEISRPGYYMLSKGAALEDTLKINEEAVMPNSTGAGILNSARQTKDDISIIQGVRTEVQEWPTLFDALRAAQGVTPYSNLTEVAVVRKQSLSRGGGRARAKLNFLEFLLSGNENVNIRLYDGDVINVARSDQALRDQLLVASRSNLSPAFIQVFVSGRVREPGARSLPQGATLNQAISSAGGPKLLRGSVEFLRFSTDGKTDRRHFSFSPSAQAGDYKNPVLISGDVVRISNSVLSAGVEVLNDLTGPAVGIYSVYSFFRP